MSDLFQDLRTEVAQRRVVVVVGAGVSIATTRNGPAASWTGLLTSGVEHCRNVVRKPEEWLQRRRAEIRSGDADELIEVAGLIGRQLRAEGEYGRWLEESVGRLRARDDSVIRALVGLGAPLLTTNYDSLIEQVTGLEPVTWRDRNWSEQVVRGEASGVLHLHGYWRDPDSVVMGSREYAQLEHDQHVQAVQQSLLLMKTLLFVGFGGGFDDPNFEAMRRWMGKVLTHSHHRHYRLCLDGEVDRLHLEHRSERIFVLGYGPTHAHLAPFLSRLPPGRPVTDADRPGAGGTGGLTATPEPIPTARGPIPTPPPPPQPSFLDKLKEALRRPVGPGGRSVPAWALLVLAAVVLAGGLLLLRPAPAGLAIRCPVPLELVVLTTPGKEASLRRLAVDFADQAPGPCRRASLTVFSVSSSSAVVGALASGWLPDALRLGPQPAVWVPDATAEVERVNRELGTEELAPLGSIATSAVVAAVPQSATDRLTGGRKVPWSSMISWTSRTAPHASLRIGRPDPTSSTAGLLATIGLHGAVGRAANPDAQRHAVEQALHPVGDELAELCELGRPGGPVRAVLVSEQAMVAYNTGAEFAGPCPGRPAAKGQRLEAVYALDGTPVLDHPFVLLPAARQLAERERLARDLFAFLSSAPVQQELRQVGFRDAARRFGGTIGEDAGVLVNDSPTWAPPPTGAALDRQLEGWQRARVPARALLAMDVSGSMAEELPGPGGRRITAARQAAAESVRLMGGRDHVGLWRFSQALAGGRDHQELVPLGAAGGKVGGRTHAALVLAELDRLGTTPRHTGLFDTMHAGIGHLRAAGGPADAVDALVVVTDGQNDDRNGGVGVDAVLDRLRAGDDVLVFLLTFGPARCDAGDLGVLARQRDLVRCLDAGRIGLDRAFEQVAATLWGTGRLAGRDAG
jgi:Bacterial extracellular solute-binding protein/SIR2-like domain